MTVKEWHTSFSVMCSSKPRSMSMRGPSALTLCILALMESLLASFFCKRTQNLGRKVQVHPLQVCRLAFWIILLLTLKWVYQLKAPRGIAQMWCYWTFHLAKSTINVRTPHASQIWRVYLLSLLSHLKYTCFIFCRKKVKSSLLFCICLLLSL